jgi:hypothetical protein
MYRIAIAAALAMAGQNDAASPPAPPAAAVAPCSAPFYAELDFLLGDWVTESALPDGTRMAGPGRMTRDEIGSCVIVERQQFIVAGRTHKGMAMTAFDPRSKSWRKTFAEESGSYTYMVGTPPPATGGPWIFDVVRTSETMPYFRETWERHGPDSMTYRWQRRKSPGDPWNDAAVIAYRRKV